MLFHSALRRELGRHFAATLLVLLSIVITMMLIRTLGLADRGSVNPNEIFLVLSYTIMGRLPTVLSLALFISVVATLSRMYRDSEMVIWLSSGRGLADFAWPLLRFAWPIIAVIAALVLLAWPWANAQTEWLRERYERRSDLERITPGQFQESANGQRVFFIEKDSAAAGSGRNVFISSLEPSGKETVISASLGRVEWNATQKLLLLDQGQQIELGLAEGQLRISEFAQYRIQIADAPLNPNGSSSLKATSTWALLQGAKAHHWGELTWRLGLVWSAFNLILLGLGLAASNPRSGKTGNLLLVLLAFIVYTNLLNLGLSWVGSGKVGALTWLLGLHGGVLALALLGLAMRQHGPSWPPLSALWRLRRVA